MKILILGLLFVSFLASAQSFPPEWFAEVPRTEAHHWEILPQDAKHGEVILSKRTELSVFSNFAATQFVLDGKLFASVEGLWQSLKFPDPVIVSDVRHQISGWGYTRDEVSLLTGHDAKAGGKVANDIYSRFGLKNISWRKSFFDYKDSGRGSLYHYNLIKRALRAKLDQNPSLWKLLLETKCLKLMPDHHVGVSDPPSYKYYEIFMELRSERQASDCET